MTQDLRLDHDPQGWAEAPLRAHELPVLRLGSLTQVTHQGSLTQVTHQGDLRTGELCRKAALTSLKQGRE